MSDALVKIMNLPCAGFDNDGEETVNREAAAAIVREIEAQLASKDAAMVSLQRRLLWKINYWTDYTSGIAAVERTYQRAAESLRALLNESEP